MRWRTKTRLLLSNKMYAKVSESHLVRIRKKKKKNSSAKHPVVSPCKSTTHSLRLATRTSGHKRERDRNVSVVCTVAYDTHTHTFEQSCGLQKRHLMFFLWHPTDVKAATAKDITKAISTCITFTFVFYQPCTKNMTCIVCLQFNPLQSAPTDSGGTNKLSLMLEINAT